MRRTGSDPPLVFLILSILVLLLVAGSQNAGAQGQLCEDVTEPPWLDGCSIGAPAFVQNGLNLIFLDACNDHDQCWATCNGPDPPYLGLGWKAQCDLTFLVQMEGACLVWAPLLSYPGSGWASSSDFLDDCNDVALAFYGAVNTPPIAFGIYSGSQCCRGCNPNACSSVGVAQIPPLCGQGQCWFEGPFPQPDPLPDPCPQFTDTTSIVDAEGYVSPTMLQLDFDLRRHEPRPATLVYLEEWAVVSTNGGQPRVSLASTAEFAARVGDSAALLAGSLEVSESVLVVESAVHPHNSRYAPAPVLEPFAVNMSARGWEGSSDTESVWFRAEVGEAGQVERVVLLGVSPSTSRELVSDAIQDSLRLRYPDDRRHRSVVFGKAEISSGGLLEVDNGLVVVAACCGCCWNPEYQTWDCPCL